VLPVAAASQSWSATADREAKRMIRKTQQKKRPAPVRKRAAQPPILEVRDTSSLTDADWLAVNSLRSAYDRRGMKGYEIAVDKLFAEDPIRYVRVMGALFPEMSREIIRDRMAALGVTREDLEERIREFEKPKRLH